MSNNPAPTPNNEFERILSLTDFDLDYGDLSKSFQDLVELAAKVSGSSISLVNLIDSYTQWSVSQFGLDIEQMPREESVCQYTILGDEQFEVKDLSADIRFSDKPYVQSPLNLRYYFGIPLTTNSGHHIGALCLLDTETKSLSPEKIVLLKLIGKEIINRLHTVKALQDLKNQLKDSTDTKNKVAHDIRGPLSGIIGISQLISEQGGENSVDDILEMVRLIHKTSRSILELADEILTEEIKRSAEVRSNDFNLSIFKGKIEKLYLPQANNKNIELSVSINPENERITFSKNKLLQIVGNLISNAIKFTPPGGAVAVNMDLEHGENLTKLKINVIDNGVGLSEQDIRSINSDSKHSSQGTTGEKGYGFGLSMVVHLIEGLNGSLTVRSEIGRGSSFEVHLPISE